MQTEIPKNKTDTNKTQEAYRKRFLASAVLPEAYRGVFIDDNPNYMDEGVRYEVRAVHYRTNHAVFAAENTGKDSNGGFQITLLAKEGGIIKIENLPEKVARRVFQRYVRLGFEDTLEDIIRRQRYDKA